MPDPLHERISDVTVIDEQLHEAARELEALRREPRFALDTARRELAYPSLLTRYVDPSTLQPLKPDLESEYLDFAEKTTFATSPIAYDRALLARVRAVAALPSVESLTTGRNRILPFLTRMALLRDEELTPYRMLDGEVGPAPPRSYLRRVALALLARRSMRGVVERMIRESPDDEEVALGLLQYLQEDARTAGDGGCGDSLSYALEAHAEKEVPRRLAAPLVGRPARLSFEIALGLLRCLTDGRPTDGIRTLARGIIDARGRTPLTSTLPGAPEDLLAAARATAWSADHYPAVDGEAVLRAPRRTPLDPWAELWRDPTTVSDAIAARLAASSTQLFFHRDELLGNHARCAFAEGWLGWADQRTRPLFDVAAEPLFVTGALVANNSEARCLVRVLTHAEGLPPAWRAELVRRVLGAALAPFRWRGDALAWERGEGRWATDIEDEALAAVEDHPAWVSEDAELARQLLRVSGGILERSDAMFASSSHEGSAWTTHRPARPSEARALDALLRLPDAARRAPRLDGGVDPRDSSGAGREGPARHRPLRQGALAPGRRAPLPARGPRSALRADRGDSGSARSRRRPWVAPRTAAGSERGSPRRPRGRGGLRRARGWSGAARREKVTGTPAGSYRPP